MKSNFYLILLIVATLLIAGLFTNCPESSSSGGSGSRGDGEIVSYTVTYDGNGNTDGSVPDSTSHDKNSTVTVAVNNDNLLKINVSGVSYKFDGWNTEANGNGINYTAGLGIFTIMSDITLYANWVPYSVQDIGPAGGYIFYDHGDYTNGWRYMEAALEDCNKTGCWGTSGITVGADGTGIGVGHANTFKIAFIDPADDKAADLCTDYSISKGGIIYDTWYLPSEDELHLMYSVLHQNGLGDFSGTYWSSTENGSNMAKGRRFSNGTVYNGTKGNILHVRALRMF